MIIFGVNIWAVLISTAASFILGGLWYSVLLGKPWAAVAGTETRDTPNPAVVYPVIFLLNILAASVFGYLFQGSDFLGFLLKGILTGIALVVGSFGINYLGAGRSLTLLAIDGSFQTLRFAAFGLVFGLFA